MSRFATHSRRGRPFVRRVTFQVTDTLQQAMDSLPPGTFNDRAAHDRILRIACEEGVYAIAARLKEHGQIVVPFTLEVNNGQTYRADLAEKTANARKRPRRAQVRATSAGHRWLVTI